MNKVTIKTKNTNLFDSKINVPIDGKINIKNDGSVKLSAEAAKLLLENYDGSWFKVEVTKEVTKEVTEEDKNNLETFSLDELIEMAKEAGIKETTYKKYKKNKKLMIHFLKEKLES